MYAVYNIQPVFCLFTIFCLHFFRYEVPTTDVEHPDIVITPLYLREKKGGHMTYSPSHLFGQPLLIALPKHNLTYEALYEKAVNSLSRYVTPPAEGSEWWKPQEPVEDELKPAALNTDPSEDSNSPTSEENQTPGKIQKEKKLCRYFWMKFCFILNQFCVVISICRKKTAVKYS